MTDSQYYIEVFKKKGLPDGWSSALSGSVKDSGIEADLNFKVGVLYILQGILSESDLERVCRELFGDPIAEDVIVGQNQIPSIKDSLAIKVSYHPGVTDAVADTVSEALHQIGIRGIEKVSTGMIYHLFPGSKLSEDTIRTICERILANPVIQHYEVMNDQGESILKG